MLFYRLRNKEFLRWILLAVFAFFLFAEGRDQDGQDHYKLHGNCEAALHKQIDQYMRASLVYMSMAAHFYHNSVSRPGFGDFFTEKAEEQKKCADQFINYLNVRGGMFIGFNTKMPTRYKWKNGLEALREAVSLEELINNKLYHLHNIAALQCKDLHLMDFIEKEFLEIQVQSINLLHRHISELKVMDSAMGEYLFDKHLISRKIEL